MGCEHSPRDSRQEAPRIQPPASSGQKVGGAARLFTKEVDPDKKSEQVTVLWLNAKFNLGARQYPTQSWNEVLEESEVRQFILQRSLINPNTLEVFVDNKHTEKVTGQLRKWEGGRVKVVTDFAVSARDTHRRARAYTRGYFLPLRRAALAGLSTDLQILTLKAAKIQVSKEQPGELKRKWLHHIKVDSEYFKIALE